MSEVIYASFVVMLRYASGKQHKQTTTLIFSTFTTFSGNCECGCGVWVQTWNLWWGKMISGESSWLFKKGLHHSSVCVLFFLSTVANETGESSSRPLARFARECAIRHVIESCWFHFYFKIVFCTVRKQVWVWHSKVHSLHNHTGL